MIKKLRNVLVLFFAAAINYVSGQAPNISYVTPQIFTTGVTLAPLSPANSGGAVPANPYGKVTTIAGSIGQSGLVNATGSAARFYAPSSIAADRNGNLFLIDDGNNVIRKITSDGQVTTFAGTGAGGAQNGPASQATFQSLYGIAVDASGNVYVGEKGPNFDIRMITPGGTVSTFAGQTGVSGHADGPASSATFNAPTDLALDNSGNLYVADEYNDLIRKVTPAGVVSTYAGQAGIGGSANGPAATATFNYPRNCAADANGNVYVTDGNNRIRKISADGNVTTLAGSGASGSADGNGAAATFSGPGAMVTDLSGNVYVCDGDNIIRKVSPNGDVTTLAGKAFVSGAVDGTGGFANFSFLQGITIDVNGNLYASDIWNETVRKITATGFYLGTPLPEGLSFNASTGIISGTPQVFSPATDYTISAYNALGGSATKVNIQVSGTLSFPAIPAVVYGAGDFSPAVSTSGPITYTTDADTTATIVAGKVHIVKVGAALITASNGSTALSKLLLVEPAPLTIIADNQSVAFNSGTPLLTATYSGFVYGEGTAALSQLPGITTAAGPFSAPGVYPIIVSGANATNYSIKYIDGSLTVLGGTTTVAAPKISYSSPQPYTAGIQITPLLPASTGGKIPAATYALVQTFAGNYQKMGAQNGPGPAATFNQDGGIAVDAANNIYVCEEANNDIRKITVDDTVSTWTGSTTAGFVNGPLSVARFNYLRGIVFDKTGNMYVNDSGNEAIRKITPDGKVSTFLSGLKYISGIATDTSGTLYLADSYDYVVDKVSATGTITQLAGKYGTQGPKDGTGTGATFFNLGAIAVDKTGTVYVVDGNAVRKITQSGVVTTFAGNFYYTNTALDGIGTAATFLQPQQITIDAANNVYVGDVALVRKITPQGLVSTIAGNRTNFVGTDGIGTAAVFLDAAGVTLDNSGNLLIVDENAEQIRKLSLNGYGINKSLPAGLVFDPTTGTISGTPSQISPLTAYTITANNISGAGTAIVNLSVNPSADATLSNLSLSTGGLSPSFNTSVANYTATVTAATDTVSITPVTTNNFAAVTVNGAAVVSQTASAPIALAVGSNTINIVVTAQDGVTTQTYTVNITRAPSPASLSNLQISSGTLNPAFASGTFGYATTVATTVASIAVTPTATDAGATIKVNGKPVASNTASAAINLAVGANTITTVVTAQDGVTKDTYTLTITRDAAGTNNAYLSNLKVTTATLTPAFAFKTLSYTASVPYGTASITVTPALIDATAAVTVNGTSVASKTASGPIALAVGANTITIVATARDGITTQAYTITITRAPSSSIATLSNFQISKGTLSPAFTSGNSSYTATVVTTTTSITVTPATTDAAATVTVNGKPVKSNTASGAISLAIGANNITTIVTAQDGMTKDTCTLTVTRDAAGTNNAWLSNLKVTTATLSPAFAFKTLTYNSTVPNSTDSVTVTPSLLDATASVTVNGVVVASKTASAPIALAVGTNTVNVVVTAADGITTNTYTVTITRAAGPVNSFDRRLSVNNPAEHPVINDDIIVVHSGLSPNGDGVNDFLQIDNINQYPDNKLSIMNRNGQLVYEARGYDNSSKIFDGHSNKNGKMQLSGTYFYQLDYTANGITKHKTGFIVLKY